MSPARLRIAALLVAMLGVALLSIMDAAMKALVLSLGVYSALLWRNLVGSVLSGAAWVASNPSPPTPAALRLHLRRGVVVAFMALLFFWAIGVLPLAEAIALSFIAPLIGLFLAAVLLKEKVQPSSIAASLLGLAGVGVIVWSRLGDAGDGGADPRVSLAIAAVLFSAVLFAYNLILTRQQALAAKPGEIAFFQTITVVGVLLIAAPWFAILPDRADWPLLLLSAVLSVAALYLFGWAYARGEAQLLIPTEYTAFAWAALCGWLFFDEEVTLPVLVGTGLIVSGSLIVARAQTRA